MEMDKDTAIRMMASMRTDLNQKIMALSMISSLPALKEVEPKTQGLEFACQHLGLAVEYLNDAIRLLGGKV